MFPAIGPAHAACTHSFLVRRVTNRVAVACAIVLFAGGCLPDRHFDDTTVIEARFPGATIEEVDAAITIPLEAALRSIDDVAGITSETQAGISRVEVRVVGGTLPWVTRGQIHQAIWGVQHKLPRGSRPLVRKHERKVVFHIRDRDGASDGPTFAAIAEGIAERLGKIPGVAGAEMVGDRPTRRVRVDSTALAERNLATSDVLSALRRRRAFTFPLEELGLVPLAAGTRLADVADVEDLPGASRGPGAEVSVRLSRWLGPTETEILFAAMLGPPLPFGAEVSIEERSEGPRYGDRRMEVAVVGTAPCDRERHARNLASEIEHAGIAHGVDVRPPPVGEPVVEIDRTRARLAGVDLREILDVQKAASDFGVELGATAEGLSVIAAVEPEGALSVRAKTGTIVPLRELVSVTLEPRVVRRRDGVTLHTVVVQLPGWEIGRSLAVLDSILESHPAPTGCRATILDRGPPDPSALTAFVDGVLLKSLVGIGLVAAVRAFRVRRRR